MCQHLPAMDTNIRSRDLLHNFVSAPLMTGHSCPEQINNSGCVEQNTK